MAGFAHAQGVSPPPPPGRSRSVSNRHSVRHIPDARPVPAPGAASLVILHSSWVAVLMSRILVEAVIMSPALSYARVKPR